jgi:hypothetical protein
MFEALRACVGAFAARRAAAKRAEIAHALSEAAPRGVAVRIVSAGVVLEGRDLRRRAVTDARIRDLLGRIR